MKTYIRSRLTTAALALVVLPSASIAADDSWQTAEPGEITESAEASAEASADASAAAPAAVDPAALAKKSQNPVADMISLPFQMNWNFGGGPAADGQFVNLVQPVIPQHLSDDWNWIHRGIIPVPSYNPGTSAWGLGDIQYEGFLSPANPGNLIWGVGPYLSFPSGTDDSLTTGKFSAGPAVLGMTMPGHWVLGGLVTQLWSYAGDDDRSDVNTTAFQPIINYNIPDSGGWYLTSTPVMTFDWENNESTIPLGGGIGKVFKIGEQHINAKAQFFGYADKPEGGPDWSMQFQITLLFPQ